MGNNLKAFIFVCVHGLNHTREVIEDIVCVANVDKMIEVYGVYDIIIEVSGEDLEITDKYREITKVHNVQSLLMLKDTEEYNV